MKRIGITQRVENVQSYSERRDCLDQRWSVFVGELNCVPIPLPNIAPQKVKELLDTLNLDALIFSGGNSITSLDPAADDVAPERDIFEKSLIAQALERNLPIFGFCRGMQVINVCLGGKLAPISGHVGIQHPISSIDENRTLPEMVNS